MKCTKLTIGRTPLTVRYWKILRPSFTINKHMMNSSGNCDKSYNALYHLNYITAQIIFKNLIITLFTSTNNLAHLTSVTRGTLYSTASLLVRQPQVRNEETRRVPRILIGRLMTRSKSLRAKKSAKWFNSPLVVASPIFSNVHCTGSIYKTLRSSHI